MRRLALAALLALAGAACSVKTEGAACADTDNCPEGQACGHDRKCSKAAAACPVAICRADLCSAGAPQRCVPEANGICAALQPQAACAGQNGCLVSAGVADCVSVAIEGPAANTVVAPAGAAQAVTARLTATTAGFPAPAALTLTAGAATTSLALQGTTDKVSTYAGTYAPGNGVEGVVELLASAGPVTSQPQPVQVDTKPPEIGTPTASCDGTPAVACARDGLLAVAVTVTEGNPGPVLAAVDLDYAATTALADGGGGSYSGQVALGARPFPGFARPVTVRVTATDVHGNAATPRAVLVSGGDVTRMRNAHDAGSAVTSPAIYASGTTPGNLVFGVDASASQLRALAPDQTLLWQRSLQINATVGGRPVKHAPSVGSQAIFAAGEDSRIYRTDLAGALSTTRCPQSTNTNTYPLGSLYTPVLRVADSPSQDHAYAAGDTSLLFQCHTDDTNRDFALAGPVHQAGVFVGAGVLLAASAGSATTLYRYGDPDNGAAPPAPLTLALLDDATPAPNACDRVSVPLATDAAGFVVIACDNGQLHRIDPAGSPLAAGYLGSLAGAPSGSPVVLAGGDYLVPLANGDIARVTTPGTAPAFSRFATLPSGEVARGLAVAAASAATGAPATVYASAFAAAAGRSALHALDLASGAVLWSAPLGTTALDFPTIAPVLSGAPAGTLPTLLVGSGEGKLFRVVVDAPLDDRPGTWPKAHHDVRNTGNAATPVNGP